MFRLYCKWDLFRYASFSFCPVSLSLAFFIASPHCCISHMILFVILITAKTQIIRPPQNQVVILSTQVRFECGVVQDDNTIPVWEWFFYKNSDLTNERQLSSSGRFQILRDGTLIVNGVSAQDIGLYKCHVISAGGNDNRTATLNVIGKWDFASLSALKFSSVYNKNCQRLSVGVGALMVSCYFLVCIVLLPFVCARSVF